MSLHTFKKSLTCPLETFKCHYEVVALDTGAVAIYVLNVEVHTAPSFVCSNQSVPMNCDSIVDVEVQLWLTYT